MSCACVYVCAGVGVCLHVMRTRVRVCLYVIRTCVRVCWYVRRTRASTHQPLCASVSVCDVCLYVMRIEKKEERANRHGVLLQCVAICNIVLLQCVAVCTSASVCDAH